MASFSWTVQPSSWTISMRSSSGAGIVSTTFAVGSSYPPIDMRRVSKWSRVDDLFEPCACALQRTGVDLGHVTEQRRLAGARRRRNYDDSACDSAIERHPEVGCDRVQARSTFAPVRAQLSSNHCAVRRRSVLYGVA